MNMAERLAASRAKINAMKEQLSETPIVETPNGWQSTDRVTRGKPVYVVYAIFKKINPVLDILTTLPLENSRHIEGGTCPHCEGSGRYSAHRGHFNNEKCFRCHGKGTLDAKDIAYLERRRQGAGPVCHIKTA